MDRASKGGGLPVLRVYRNCSKPTPPLEPKEEREAFGRQWDSVQDFFAHWEKNGEQSDNSVSAKGKEKREQMCSRFFFDWIEYLASENLQFDRIRFRAETVWLIGRDGDCGPRSGEPIPSLAISSLRRDKDLTGSDVVSAR